MSSTSDDRLSASVIVGIDEPAASIGCWRGAFRTPVGVASPRCSRRRGADRRPAGAQGRSVAPGIEVTLDRAPPSGDDLRVVPDADAAAALHVLYGDAELVVVAKPPGCRRSRCAGERGTAPPDRPPPSRVRVDQRRIRATAGWSPPRIGTRRAGRGAQPRRWLRSARLRRRRGREDYWADRGGAGDQRVRSPAGQRGRRVVVDLARACPRTPAGRWWRGTAAAPAPLRRDTGRCTRSAPTSRTAARPSSATRSTVGSVPRPGRLLPPRPRSISSGGRRRGGGPARGRGAAAVDRRGVIGPHRVAQEARASIQRSSQARAWWRPVEADSIPAGPGRWRPAGRHDLAGQRHREDAVGQQGQLAGRAGGVEQLRGDERGVGAQVDDDRSNSSAPAAVDQRHRRRRRPTRGPFCAG